MFCQGAYVIFKDKIMHWLHSIFEIIELPTIF